MFDAVSGFLGFFNGLMLQFTCSVICDFSRVVMRNIMLRFMLDINCVEHIYDKYRNAYSSVFACMVIPASQKQEQMG